MKIRLGPAGVPTVCRDRSTLAGIRTCKELGLRAMEIEFVRGVKMSNALAREAGDLARKLDIELSVHAPYYINLCNPEKRQASMKRILDSCERGHHLGAEAIVFHPGYYGEDPEKCFGMVQWACRRMASAIERNGWKVKLALETTGRTSQIGTLEEIVKICREVPKCIPCVDWAHLYARNQGKIDFGKVFQALKLLKLKHLHCHFSCINWGSGGEKNHLTLAKKKPDYLPLVKEILKRKPFDMTLISESPVLEQDALALKKMFKKEGHKFK